MLLATLHCTGSEGGEWDRIHWEEYQFEHRIHLNWILDLVLVLSLSGLWFKMNIMWNQRLNGMRLLEHYTSYEQSI